MRSPLPNNEENQNSTWSIQRKNHYRMKQPVNNYFWVSRPKWNQICKNRWSLQVCVEPVQLSEANNWKCLVECNMRRPIWKIFRLSWAMISVNKRSSLLAISREFWGSWLWIRLGYNHDKLSLILQIYSITPAKTFSIFMHFQFLASSKLMHSDSEPNLLSAISSYFGIFFSQRFWKTYENKIEGFH